MGVWATRQRTVLRACAIAGDEVKLAELLGVPVQEVVDWVLGNVTVPTAQFLALVDIVLDDNRKGIELNRDFIQRVRERHQR
jgi:hypothetical protein